MEELENSPSVYGPTGRLTKGEQDRAQTWRQAATSIADLLRDAADQRLDVTMFASSLRTNVRDALFKQVCEPTFAELLRRVLESNCKVRVLLWHSLDEQLISESLKDLIAQFSENTLYSSPGKIDVRISGTDEFGETLCHFMCAHSTEESDNWILRLEPPHRASPLDAHVDPDAPCPPFALVRGARAKSLSSVHLGDFDKSFSIIGNRIRRLISENKGAERCFIEVAQLCQGD